MRFSEAAATSGAFVAAIRRHFDDPDGVLNDYVQWVGGGVAPDGVAVVLYREQPGGPVVGRRYDVAAYASEFGPEVGFDELVSIAFTNEITDPTGRGEALDVDWADGFVSPGTVVEWVGDLYRG